MFNTLFDHIKNHKGWYSLVAVIVLLAVVAMTYGRMPGDTLGETLTGNIKGITKTTKKIATPTKKPITKPVVKPVDILTVAKTAIPISQTHIKGEENVPALGFAMTADRKNDITVNKIAVRIYGDSDGAFGTATPTGDMAANAIVSSVMLYEGNDVISGPKSLQREADYYKAVFENLDLEIGKGDTRTLTAKVRLLNTMQDTTYLALDIGTNDITGVDRKGNVVSAPVNHLNLSPSPNPMTTVLTQGVLTAVSEGNPASEVVTAGSSNVMVARYRFHAVHESFDVNKLTVINDLTTAFDTAVATNAVNQVTLKYPDINGVIQFGTAYLSSGSTTLSGLSFHVPAGEDAYLEIYADVNAMANVGQSLSGQTFRLGIMDTGNTTSRFKAVGQSSASADYFVDGDEIINAASVNTFVVRKTKPTFSKASGISTTLINGENRLYGVTVSANNAGAISFGRLVFDVNATNVQLNDFKFYRGGTMLNSDRVNIHDGINDIGLLSGNSMTGNKVIVSFNAEETVAAGSSQTYYLDAMIIGAISNSAVITRLASSDSAVIPGEQLYPSFINTLDNNRNILWSDKSADVHLYPTIQDGNIIGAGSSDWTNGYLLKANELSSHSLMY